ncbi:hypothetical protein ACM1ZW_20090 [Pseudomonas sp. NFX71]|uniref:hypothetical protein n=1 Tax=Pseudomonas sp. NFX71 TaxID=3399121 RepID=UPI003A8515D5
MNFGGFINVWGRYERFVLSDDIMYVDATYIDNFGPLPAFSIPDLGVIPPGGNIDAKVDTKQFTATLMGGYRVINAPGLSLDALAGARVWHISNRMKVTGSLGGLSKSASYRESFSWVEHWSACVHSFPLRKSSPFRVRPTSVGLAQAPTSHGRLWLPLIMLSEIAFPPP